MHTITIASILMIVFLILIISFVIIISIILIKRRYEKMKTTLPSLDELNKNSRDKNNVDQVKMPDNSNQLNEAMSVSSKDEFNRKDYIKTDKHTSLQSDFGGLFGSTKTASDVAHDITSTTKPVKLPELDKKE